MKYLLGLILISQVGAFKHKVTHKINGIPVSQLQDGSHWRKPWPQGIDDGSDDDGILNLPRIPKNQPKPAQ